MKSRKVYFTVIISYVLLLIFFLVILSINANAHSWYDKECCSGRDCHPIPAPQRTPSGYTLPNGWKVPWNKVKKGQDMDYHLCNNQWNVFCLYEPGPGT